MRRFYVRRSRRSKPWKEAYKVRFEQATESSIDAYKEPDGSVWGVRYFRAVRPGYLMSPSSLFVWETHEAVADDFSNSEAVRGHVGFHAAWPEDLKTWTQSFVDHQQCEVKALVRGFGDVVLGDVGWRSSRLRIVRAVLDYSGLSLRDVLSKRYPSVEFSEGWMGNVMELRVAPEFSHFNDLAELYKYIEACELMEEYK